MDRASPPKPIDILVRISLYERTGSRPDRTEEPGVLERGVAVHTGPDSFAGRDDVVDLPSAPVDAGVDATEEGDEGGPGRLEVGGITEPERGQPRTEHHRVQVGYAGPRKAAVVPEVGHPVGDGIVGDGWKHKGSGEPAVVKMVHVWTMRDGKAVAFQQHVDTVRVRELS